MEMTSHHIHSHTRRYRIQRWAFANAWRLSIFTAIVTLVGLFIAVSLSLLLRPTRSYFFPLLSDVDKHHPERAILRLAFFSTTLLLLATTFASILHARSIKTIRDRSTASSQSPHEESVALSAAEAIRPVDIAFRGNAVMWPSEPASDVIVPVTPRRRRVSRLQIIVFFPVLLTIWAIAAQSPEFSESMSTSMRSIRLETLCTYTISLAWIAAFCFLVWYFLKLQSIPEPLIEADNEQEVTILGDEQDPTSTNLPGVDRMRALVAWAILALRPICLTGQVVCIIKIAGLRLALDTFSISRIRLVRRALLAALAFAEYTAAFFFAFFMAILAVDLRAKTADVDALV